MFDVTLTDIFQYQSQFVDTCTVKNTQRKIYQITDKFIYYRKWPYITHIGALSTPLFALKILVQTPVLLLYIYIVIYYSYMYVRR